jgi:hypothetical protein
VTTLEYVFILHSSLYQCYGTSCNLLNIIVPSFLNFLYILASEMMAQRDPASAAGQKYKPIQSAIPGTTLGPIQINAFLGGGVSHFI